MRAPIVGSGWFAAAHVSSRQAPRSAEAGGDEDADRVAALVFGTGCTGRVDSDDYALAILELDDGHAAEPVDWPQGIVEVGRELAKEEPLPLTRGEPRSSARNSGAISRLP